MKDFDLNIDNYSVDDLETFFQVAGSPYDDALLQKTHAEWLKKVSGLDAGFRDPFRAFLQNARNRLVRERLSALRNPPAAQPPVASLQGVSPQRGEIVQQEAADLYPKPIVSKADKPFVYARNSEYFGGTLNPLDKHLSTRVISINSLLRDNYAATSATDFMFRFPDPVKNVASLELMSLELPAASIFDVTQKHASNYFTVSVTGVTGVDPAVRVQVVLPNGNYSAPPSGSAGAVMENILNKVLSTSDEEALQYLICSIDPYSLETMFYLDPAHAEILESATFEIDFCVPENDRLYKNLGWKLGFRRGAYSGSLLSPVVSESAYTPVANQYIFLEVDDYNRNNQTNAIMAYADSKSYISNNILARISLQELALQGVSQIFKKREFFGGVRLERLHIRLLDYLGRPLDMNYADFSMALELRQIYA